MDISKPPDAIHGKSIDLASEGDRVWFEENPGRRHRLRDMIPFENNGPMELPPFGMTWRVVVTEIKTGVRFRLPVALPAELPNEGADDSHHSELLQKVAPPDAKKILKAAAKEREKK
jgi:hypothetical protein